MGSKTIQVPTDSSNPEVLKQEIERLKRQIEKTKARNLEYLGEVISADLLPELAGGGKLSARAAKTRGEGMHGDGGNLWLQVTPGGRSWLFRFRFGGKQREMGVGSLGEVSLAEARGRAVICRRLVRSGVDPIERRKAIAAAAPAGGSRTTFAQAAQRYFDSKRSGWRSDKHTQQFLSTMRDFVNPIIGDWPVAAVDTDAVMKILEPIWTTKPETASRVRARIEQVLGWAAALKMRQGENPARWRGHLQSLLPARSAVRAVVHHAALPYVEMHAFWQALGARTSASSEALRLVILTAARTSEVTGAKWSEIDLAARTWTIPAQRMKAHREHRVALCDLAIEVLQRMQLLSKAEGDYVFPGAKPGAPLSQMAMTMGLRKLGRGDITVHGFRSTFRDWAAERTSYPGDLVELALAHAVGNKVEAAYRRGDQIERRFRLMNDWGRFCTTPPISADNVRTIGEGRA